MASLRSALQSLTLRSRPDKVASIEFDPKGDVLLVLSTGSGIARFRVNSHILCISSPVFRAMLGEQSQFKERAALSARTPTSEPLELPLADDDPKALGVILRVIQRQYDGPHRLLTSTSFTRLRLFAASMICGNRWKYG